MKNSPSSSIPQRAGASQNHALCATKLAPPLLLATLCSLNGCAPPEEIRENVLDSGITSGNSEGTTSQGGDTDGQNSSCNGDGLVSAKRIVRLSFNQVANSLATLLDEPLGLQIAEGFEIVDAGHRAFPPLQSPREGNSFTDQSWSSVDQIAQEAGAYVSERIETITGCGPAPTDDCALSYLTGLAEKAYRRPLSPEETTRLTTLYNEEFRGIGSTVAESIQYGVYAIFQSPNFLYRTEFGLDANAAGPLTQLEKASMLSYFLTDDTPDELLMNAAIAGELETKEQVEAQVDRLLMTDAARENLEGAMISYFSYPNLENQIIQDDAFTGDMRRSMYQEAELFLQESLWDEPLNHLLTSKVGYMDANVASIYGVANFPPPAATPVNEDFYLVDLPENRSGLLTQPGFLANRSRPDHTSVVGRGLLIKGALLCTETPSPSEAVFAAIEELQTTHPDASEREMADLRAGSAVCASCHESFDPYGLALDTFDVLGRYREVDWLDRPIDPTVTLPKDAGGGEAANIVEVADQLAASGAFGKCMGQNLVNFALADVSAGAATIKSCAVQEVNTAFQASDQTFPSLIKAVATSAVFSQRTNGDQQ